MPYLVKAYEKGKLVKEFWDCLRDTPLGADLAIDGLKELFPDYEYKREHLTVERMHEHFNAVEKVEREKKSSKPSE